MKNYLDNTVFEINGSVISYNPIIIKTNSDEEFEIDYNKNDLNANQIKITFDKLAKNCSISELKDVLKHTDELHNPQKLYDLINILEKNGIIHKTNQAQGKSGIEVLLEIEDLSNKLLYETIYS